MYGLCTYQCFPKILQTFLSTLCFESSVHTLIIIFLNPSKYYFAAKGVRVSFRARWQAIPLAGASVKLHDS